MERRLGLRHRQPLPELGSIDNNDDGRRPNRIRPFIFPLSLISVIIHIFLSSYKNRAYRKTIPTCAKTRRARTQGRDAGWFLPGARPKGITIRRQMPPIWSQKRVDTRNTYERLLCVVPMVGAGTYEDPRRPATALPEWTWEGWIGSGRLPSSPSRLELRSILTTWICRAGGRQKLGSALKS